SKTRLKAARRDRDRYMASNDPVFQQKATDIIVLYVDPPQHAALFCVDEMTAIEALDRLYPVLPLCRRLRAPWFEYYRPGTLWLCAALDVRSGKVQGKTAKRHTSAEFINFLEQVLASAPAAQEIDIVLTICRRTRRRQ
ncbi:MAG TPA: hypothetical protein VKY31_15050, partial [Terriglobia bacterium]|nr:hypothetical protein [Terriglobia bacterium]